MNAIDFIKQHGIEKARKVVEGAPKWAMSINFNNGMYYSRMEHKKGDTFLYDIKRLIESVELVNSLGGVQEATNKAFDMTMLVVGFNPDKIEQAITGYKAIYSNDMVDDTHIENHVCPLCKVGGEVMRSEFNNWYEKWTGSKVKCENTDIIGAWQHQQSKIDKLQKRVDAVKGLTQTLWEKSEEKHQQGKAWESKTLGECADEILDELEQALKGGSDE